MSAGRDKGSAQAAPNFDLDSAISAVRAERGSAAQALALEQRLAETLGRAALAGAGGASGAGGAGWGAGWLLVLGLGTLGLLALRAHVAHDPAPSTLRAEPRGPALPVAALPVAAVLSHQGTSQPARIERSSPPVALERVVSRSADQPRRRARSPQRVASPVVARAALPAPAAVQDELRLLQRARAALRADPQAAFALAQQHARAYPHGMFAQEREVLAIEALLRQRARGAAFARAQAFVASNPGSPYALRIRALIDQQPRALPPSAAPAAVPEDPAAEAPAR